MYKGFAEALEAWLEERDRFNEFAGRNDGPGSFTRTLEALDRKVALGEKLNELFAEAIAMNNKALQTHC